MNIQTIAWKSEIGRALGIIGTGVLLGWSAGYIMWGAFGGLLVTVLLMLSNMFNFYLWAAHKGVPPQTGILGYSADSLIRREKMLTTTIEQQQQILDRHFQGIDSLHDGVLILENTGHMLHFNRAAQRLLNLRANDRGQIITNLIRNPRLKEYLQTNNNDFVQIDVRHRRNYSLQIQVTGFGQEQKLLLIQDITERKNVETMRKSFIANASHELRTPLTVINGYLEMFSDLDESQQQQVISKIQQQSSRMKELIDDLLHLSKLETDTPHSCGEWFDLKHLAYSVIQQLPDVAQTRILFECEVEIDVLGFAGEMHTILMNLLTNALKYGGDGMIHLHFDASFHGVKVSVIDHGAGIDEEYIPHLTERFYRVQNDLHKSQKGSGLGLAIVKHALELHTSQLEIHSKVGQGSTFSFTLHPERCRFHR